MKKLSMKEMEELIKKEEREVNDLILLQQQVVVELAYQDKNSRIVQTEINYLKQEAKEIISLFDRYSACFGKSFF